MENVIAAAILSILSVGVMDSEPGGHGRPIQLPGEPDGFRNLLLNALGTRPPDPGQVRIPIAVDGAVYEVVVSKPGEPRYVPIAKAEADLH